MKHWITACNENGQVIFNVAEEFANLGAALAFAVANVPANCHESIIITDMDNNNLFPCATIDQHLVAHIGNWNKRKQCYVVRVTAGNQNLQWMSDNERAMVSVVYREDFKHTAQAKAWAASIGASVQPGWD